MRRNGVAIVLGAQVAGQLFELMVIGPVHQAEADHGAVVDAVILAVVHRGALAVALDGPDALDLALVVIVQGEYDAHVVGIVVALPVEEGQIAHLGGVAVARRVQARLLELVDPADALHPGFLVDAPAEGDRREGGPLVAFGELGGTVTTHGGGDQVAVVVGVVDTGHVGLHLLLGEAGTEGAQGADAAHVVPEGFLDREVLGIHADEALVVGVCGVQEGEADAVLAELAVVVEEFVEGPGEVGLLVVEGVVRTGAVEALLGDVQAAVGVPEVRTEVHAEAQALEGSPHLAEVDLGVDAADDAHDLAQVGLVVPLAVDVLDAVVTARILDAVAVVVEGDCVGITLGRDAVSGALAAALEVAGAGQAVVLDAVGSVEAGAEGEPLVGLEVIGGLEREALVVLSVDGTLVGEVAEGGVGLELVGTAGSGERVLVGDGRLEDQAHPVGGLDLGAVPGSAGPALHDVAPGVGVAAAVEDLVVVLLGRRGRAGIVGRVQVVVGRTAPVDVLGGGHPGRLVLDGLIGEGTGIVDMHLALGALLYTASSFLNLFECGIFPRALQQHTVQEAVGFACCVAQNLAIADPGLGPGDDSLLKLCDDFIRDILIDVAHDAYPFLFSLDGFFVL